MIRNCFTVLPGIQEKTQEKLYQQGITDWDRFIDADALKGIQAKRKHFYDRKLKELKKAIFEDDLAFLIQSIPPKEQWRLYATYKGECAFLDIETSSVEQGSYPTIVGIFDGIETKILVKDHNLDARTLRRMLAPYKMIVTFNGNVFDLPYLEKFIPGIIGKVLRVDLRTLCNRLGLMGGLKMIEKELGIKRSNLFVEQLYGGDPIKLWRKYKATGDPYFLDLLIEYNEEDIINLKPILEHCLSEMNHKMQENFT